MCDCLSISRVYNNLVFKLLDMRSEPQHNVVFLKKKIPYIFKLTICKAFLIHEKYACGLFFLSFLFPFLFFSAICVTCRQLELFRMGRAAEYVTV